MRILQTMFVIALFAGLLTGCQKKVTPLPQTVISTPSSPSPAFSPAVAITPAVAVAPVLPVTPAVRITPAIPNAPASGQNN